MLIFFYYNIFYGIIKLNFYPSRKKDTGDTVIQQGEELKDNALASVSKRLSQPAEAQGAGQRAVG